MSTSKKTGKSITKTSVKKKSKSAPGVPCADCKKTIAARDQALFVEQEVGRYFCSEACIVAFFTPEIEKLEQEYGKNVSAHDLTASERETYAHIRWLSLEDPHEIWQMKTAQGDTRYTLISQHQADQKTIYAIAICLMLDGEPSFLFLAFITQDQNLLNVFRKGVQQVVNRTKNEEVRTTELESRVAEPWTESDSIHAQIIKSRKASDIPGDEFTSYQKCLEETLQEPTELWSYLPKAAKRVYHFIRKYSMEQDYWYVVMAKDTPDDSQIEIVDAFPTNDLELIQLCRHGRKEPLGQPSQESLAPMHSEKLRRNVH